MMIRFQRSLAVAAAGALMFSATVAQAEATRPGSSVPMVSKAVTDKMVVRASQRVKRGESLTGLNRAIYVVAGVGSLVALAVLVGNKSKKDSRG